MLFLKKIKNYWIIEILVKRERLFNKWLKCFVLIKYGLYFVNLNLYSIYVFKILNNFILLVIFYWFIWFWFFYIWNFNECNWIMEC